MEAGGKELPQRLGHFFAMVIGLAALAVVLSASLFSNIEARQRQTEVRHLWTLAQLQTEQLETWLAGRRRDIELFVANPEVQESLGRYLAKPDTALGERLKKQIRASPMAEGAASIELVDSRNRVVLAFGHPVHEAAPIQPNLRPGGAPLRATLVDMHRDHPEDDIHFGLEAALPSGSAGHPQPFAFLRVNFDAGHTIDRQLQRWSQAGTSGEMVLVRQEGDELVNLSDLRHPPHRPLAFRQSLSAPTAPILAALTQPEMVYEGPDWRQVEVIAAARAIAGTPWTLMFKKDSAEVTSDLRRLHRLVIALILGAMLGTGLLLRHFWRRPSEDSQVAQLADLAATLPGALVSYRRLPDGSSCIPYASPAIQELCGLAPAQLQDDASPILRMVHPDDRERFEQSIIQSSQQLTPSVCEFRIRHPGRGDIWVEGCSRPRREADGATVWHGFIHEISARRKAEDALRGANERWRRLADAIPQLVWASDPGGRCHYVNQNWLAYTGHPADGHFGQGWREFVHPEDRQRLIGALAQAVADDRALGGEYRLRRADGEYHWFKTHLVPVDARDGPAGTCYAFNTDIQELKAAESALQRSLLRQQALQHLDRAILESSTPEEVAARALAHLTSLLQCWGANAMTFDFEAGEARILARQRQDGSNYDPGRQVSLASYGYGDLAALERAQVCRVADLAALPDRPALLETLLLQGVHSYVRIPLMVEGRLTGAINLVSDRVGFFGQADVDAALPIADILAIALQQAFLRQRLIEQTTTLETRVAERTAELEHLKDQAEAANRAKSRFLANISHELRTPLNSLLILSELLADNIEGNLTPEQMEFARVIHGAGGDLLNLINDILDLSKIESGRAAVVHSDVVSIEELHGYVDRLFRRAAEDKNLAFSLEAAPGLPAALRTDLNHLKPILRNLVGNAIKFTSAGSVTLHIRPAPSGWSTGHSVLSESRTVIAFDVVDTGIGIAPEKLPRIFEVFEQAEANATRRYGGTGLGLHIARVNAELLGGELAAASTPGEGSTFTLFLPLEYKAPGSAVRADSPPAPQSK